MSASDIHIIKLGHASPIEPLGQSVNAFLVGPPYALINTGHVLQVDTLKAELLALGVEPGAIERIVCTSWSLDIVGAARHFPRADVFVLSPDGSRPRRFDAWVQAEQTRLAPYFAHVGADFEAFSKTWFGGSPKVLDFIPISVGSTLAVANFRFDVLPLNGFDPGAMMLFDPDAGVLFPSEFMLNGLPANVRNPQGFLGDLDRATALGAKRVYPNHGMTSERGDMDMRRAARWANNLLSNAQHAMRGGVTAAAFVERDLGYLPDPTELALRMAAMQPFLEELVESRVIEASGEGLDRIYGTNVETRV